MSEPLTKFDIGALSASLFVLAAYHFVFFWMQQHANDPQLSFNVRNVAHWLHKHKEKSDANSGTLAIHTLRNTIMVSVFIGGYALTVAYSSASGFDVAESEQHQVRTVCLSILLFCSFLCWALVIRHAAQLGYMIGTLDYEDKSDLDLLNHLSGHEHNGTTGATAVEVSERSKSRAEKYPFDRKVALKQSEKLLQCLIFYFRYVECVILCALVSLMRIYVVLDSDSYLCRYLLLSILMVRWLWLYPLLVFCCLAITTTTVIMQHTRMECNCCIIVN